MCTLDLQRPPTPTVSITTRRLKAIDTSVFGADVRSSLAEIDFATLDVDSCVENYNQSLSCLLDKHAPSRTRTVKLRPNSPWFHEGIWVAKQKRRQLECRWRSDKLEINRQYNCTDKRML